MRVTRLAAAAVLALLAAGCAGQPTAEPVGEQVEVQGVTSTAAEAAAIDQPAATQPSATMGRSASTRPATTLGGTAAAGRPAGNPVLTVIVGKDTAGGMVAGGIVVDPPGETCTATCTYPQFPKGQTIELRPVNLNTDDFTFKIDGGRSTCDDGQPCHITLSMDTTVTVSPKASAP